MTTAIDARGKACPMPIVLLAKAAKETAPGDTITIQADDRAFPEDVKAWCSKTKNELISLAEQGGYYEAKIRRA
jgi:tRNA 2-thiouridine synthesizing protein A